MTVSTLVQAARTPPSTLRQVALDDALGKELRTAGRKSAEWLAKRDELIWLAHVDGASLREIAAAVGLSNPGVLRIVRRMGERETYNKDFKTLRDAGIVEVTPHTPGLSTPRVKPTM